MSKHQKHPPVAKRHRGNFAHREVALIGAPCSLLQQVATSIQRRFDGHRMGYFDADHHPEPVEDTLPLFWTDHQDYSTTRNLGHLNDWDLRTLTGSLDLALVNGNHFSASEQIVFVHPKKLESLSRKTDQLTHVRALVFCEGENTLPDFLQACISDATRTFKMGEPAIHDWFEETFLGAPPLKGLVLAGGRSTRMGVDKGLMKFHGKAQREVVADLLSQVCQETWISCRDEQVEGISSWGQPLPDRMLDFGPYGALMTAYMHDPDAAWLVVACDMPGLDLEALEFLVRNRDTSKVATAFRKDSESFPEPLITIWEPKAYPRMLAFLAQGNTCPRKVLINSDVHVMDCPVPRWIGNVNTPEEADAWRHG